MFTTSKLITHFTRIAGLLALLECAICQTAGVRAGAANVPSTFHGNWMTSWTAPLPGATGGVVPDMKMSITVNAAHTAFTGTYEFQHATFSGNIYNTTLLDGTFKQDGGNGLVVFKLLPDGEHFVGTFTWTTGAFTGKSGYWIGHRVAN